MTGYAPEVTPAPPLEETLRRIPDEALPWVVRGHLDYLDGKFHDIDRLTHYLVTCRPIEKARVEYVRFVDSATFDRDQDIDAYVDRFAQRYDATRVEVLQQCATILDDDSIWSSRRAFAAFWRDFAYTNEYDSLHGMFLTSGRWYTNAILPVVRVIAEGFLERTGAAPVALAPFLAVEVITPEYVVRDRRVERPVLAAFAAELRELLHGADRVVLDVFELARQVPHGRASTVEELARDVKADPASYAPMLSRGLFPPFAWHELRAEETRVRQVDRAPSTGPLSARELEGVAALHRMKGFEADYNAFNYKGHFPLVSKYFWWLCVESGAVSDAEAFTSAVLGDRFYEALALVDSTERVA